MVAVLFEVALLTAVEAGFLFVAVVVVVMVIVVVVLLAYRAVQC